jgi:LuxR family maltose regulon positive regulatory protein
MEPLVERPRLRQVLDRGGVRLTIVTGPPGSGKTTLLRQWLASPDEGRRACAWVTADPDAPSAARFWESVLDALDATARPVPADIRRSLDDRPSDVTLVGTLVDHFVAHVGPEVVLVIDDYHAVSSVTVHRQLASLIDHCPPSLRIVLATRHDPPLPTGRWRARGELAEVRGSDLQFDRSEMAAMFDSWEPGTADLMAERTEGWAAGLQLAALAARRAPYPVTYLRTLDGSEAGITEFLVQEALEPQPPELQEFLLSTAMLESFDTALCDAVRDRPGSDAFIARLLSRHLFLVPLDPQHHTFRYHRLFADVLRDEVRRVHPERQAPVLRRAAAWHAAQGDPKAAIPYALAGADYALALEHLLAHHFALSGHGDWPLVLKWLEAIPEAALADDPSRALDYALLLVGTGRVAEAGAVASRVEPLLPADGPDALRATVALIHATDSAVNGDHDEFFLQAVRVNSLMTEDHPVAAAWSLMQAWMLGLTSQYAESHALFAKAASDPPLPPDLWSLGAGFQAETLAWQGSLHEAAVRVKSALRDLEGPDVPYSTALSSSLRAQAIISLEGGRLAEADAVLQRALESDKAAPIALQRVLTVVLRAEVARAHRQPNEALALIDDAWRPSGTRPLGPLLRTYLAEGRVRAELDLGLLDAAAHSAADATLPGTASLLRARVALAEGERRAAYLHLTAAGRQIGEDDLRRHVQCHLLKARSLLEFNPGRARHHVKKALELATPEGLLWTLAQEGELAPLFAEAAGRQPVPGLGALVTQRLSSPALGVIDLVDEPSDRELQVLALLARGLSYQQIADELFLSRNTVKAHAQSVYRKIGAHNRADAAAQARRMGLVSDDSTSTP